MKKTINNIYPETKLKIAIAQTKSLDGHIEENIKTAINKIEYASKQGADIIVFPEKFLTGYVPEMIETNIGKYTITNNDARLELLYKACKDNKISAFSVMCNHVGKTGKWDATGKSAVWNPYGQLIKEASQDNEEVLIVELDPKLLKEAREAEKMLEDSLDLHEKSYDINKVKLI